MHLVFIVNGENIELDVSLKWSLRRAAYLATFESYNDARDITHWEVRDVKGTYLDPSRPVGDYSFVEGTRLFVSLRVGAGGSRKAA